VDPSELSQLQKFIFATIGVGAIHFFLKGIGVYYRLGLILKKLLHPKSVAALEVHIALLEEQNKYLLKGGTVYPALKESEELLRASSPDAPKTSSNELLREGQKPEQ